jgi:hypothetical protein
MTAMNNRMVFGLILCAVFAVVMAVPQVWIQPVSNAVLIIILAVITLDWVWLRMVQPAVEHRIHKRFGGPTV